MRGFALKALALTIGCAASTSVLSQQIPAMPADDSHVVDPPRPIEPGMKGYGVRAVEGQTLAAMLEKCRSTNVKPSAVEQARCEQLRRTRHTQPGNSTD